jgi:hypothetical protein
MHSLPISCMYVCMYVCISHMLDSKKYVYIQIQEKNIVRFTLNTVFGDIGVNKPMFGGSHNFENCRFHFSHRGLRTNPIPSFIYLFLVLRESLRYQVKHEKGRICH